MTTLSDLHQRTRRRFVAAGLETPDLDARLLLEHCTGTTRLDLIRAPERIIAPEQSAELEKAVARRLAGEPVHRILGWREFYGLRLSLSPDTLEPRPDTEALVDLVLPRIRATAARKGSCSILDLGTGTGAIALALLSTIPQARALGADVAQGALETANANAEANGLADRFDTALSDWFGEISGRFDAIVSNPPYITDCELADLPADVKDHDPLRALSGGSDGLDAYRAIAKDAASHLEPGGVVAVEIGSRQKADVVAIFSEYGFGLDAEKSDLGGRDRAVSFTL